MQSAVGQAGEAGGRALEALPPTSTHSASASRSFWADSALAARRGLPIANAAIAPSKTTPAPIHTAAFPQVRRHLSRDTIAAHKSDWAIVGKFALLITVLGLGLVLSVGVAHAAPTKAQFIRQGDALCREVQRELAPLVRRAQAAKSLPERQQWAAAEQLWADQIQIQARFTRRLRAVGVPTRDSGARSIVLGLDRGLVLARRVRDAFARRSTTSLAVALPEYVRFTVSLNRRVAAYGFKVCGRS